MAHPLARRLAFGAFSAHPTGIDFVDATAMAHAMTASDIAPMSYHTGRYAFRPGAEISAPATFIWAGRDRLVVPGDAARAARALPDAMHLLVSGSGHLLMNDAPDAIARIIAPA